MTDETVFAVALEKRSATERAAFLDEACADDPALRQRVEALLHAHDKAGDYLEQPALVQMAGGAAPAKDATAGLDPAGRPERVSPRTEPGDGEEDAPLDFLQPSTKPGSLGRLGHYEVLQVLGRGGFGIVFRAFDDNLQRVVAIKVMAQQIATLSPARKRFVREARSSAAVRHENVVQVYEVEEQPLPYLVMEFIPGESLQQKLDRTGPLGVPEVLRIGRQIAEGLAAAHANDLIHRDIKPGNVLIESGPQQRAKITDFGLARAADDASISQSGVIAGTPMFMAPEQALGHKLDQRADLFSLGSVLYQMVSGRPPFRASSTLAVLKRVAEDPPRPIQEIIPETPTWLCDIIAKLHAKNPDDRFQSAREIADVLADCDAQLKAHAKVKDFSRIPRGKPRRSGPWKWAAAAAGFLILIAGTVGIIALGTVGTIALLNHNTDRVPNPEDTKPVVGADKHDGPAIDLIPLARPDPALGNWKREGDTLVCTPRGGNGMQNVPIPIDLPREYELEAVLERLAGDEFISFHMAAFGSTFWVGCDAVPSSGSWSGLGTIEKKQPWENGIGTHGAQLTVGKQRTLRCTVRASGIVATLDDKLLVNYSGGFGKLDANYPDVRGAKLYAQVHDTVGVRVHRLRLTQLAPEDKTNAPPLAVAPFDAAKASANQEAWAKHLGVDVETTNSIGMKLRLIPPGQFLMGSPADEPGRNNDNEDQHEVILTKPFCIGIHDVTVGQFKAFVKATGYQTEAEKGGGGLYVFADGSSKLDPGLNWRNPGFEQTDEHPVVCVSWNDAQAFCKSLSVKEGKTYALPTEAQWEYACRAGSRTKFCFGNENQELVQYAWYRANSGLVTHAVGQQKPNAWGPYDMHGNVWQWTADWYAPDCDQKEDPPGPSVGTRRVIRGGCYSDAAKDCRAAVRHGDAAPSARNKVVGFRVVQVGDLKAKTPPLAIAPFDVAKAKHHQDGWAKHLGVAVETSNSIGMKLRLIPPGKFVMGSPDTEPRRERREGPQHAVVLTRPFYMGAHDVTFGQFKVFVKETGYQTEAEKGDGAYRNVDGSWQRDPLANWQNPGFEQTDDHPVVSVSWNDANTFCNWLSKKEKRTYQLPTEAQWEYACRAGTTTVYSFGDDPKDLSDYAWYKDNAGYHTHPIAGKKPNPWGLYDMHGNVCQWCQDYYVPYPSKDVIDPLSTLNGSEGDRVFRGGSWGDDAGGSRAAVRRGRGPGDRGSGVGFRVCFRLD